MLFNLAVCSALPTAFVTMASAAPQVRAYAVAYYSETKTETTGPVSAQTSQSSDAGTRLARSTADYGILRVYAEGHSIENHNTGGLMSSGAQAYWQDTLTIDAPGLTGQIGTLTVKFTIDGILSASGQAYTENLRAYARASFVFTRSDYVVRDGGYTVHNDGSTLGAPFLGQEQTATFTFTYGTAFDLKLAVETVARAYTYYSADAEGDLSSTATWGGFVSVKDQNGAEVSNYAASSVSGANYVEPILPPVPRLVLRRFGPGIQLRWSTNFNGYTPEFSDNLSTSIWSALTNAVGTEQGDTVINLPIGETPRFFRLRQ